MAHQPIFTFKKEVALALTPEALFSARKPCCRLDIQAQTDNTGYIEIQLTGDAAGVGIRLQPGETFTFDFAAMGKMNVDAATIFIRCEVNTDGVQGIGQTA